MKRIKICRVYETSKKIITISAKKLDDFNYLSILILEHGVNNKLVKNMLIEFRYPLIYHFK
jgi:hypothetical protein